jgi:hypothetical protein
MKARNTLALSCVLSGTLAGCCCPHVHGPDPGGTGATTAIPTAQAGVPAPTPCQPQHPPTQTVITAGNYCVCNAGAHNTHGTIKGPHIAANQVVVVGALDMATDVEIGPDKLPMYLSSDNKRLHGFMNYPHTRTPAGGTENTMHLVRIEPVTLTEETAPPGCTPGANTLKISFCYRSQVTDKWECKPAEGDLGDTHVQN